MKCYNIQSLSDPSIFKDFSTTLTENPCTLSLKGLEKGTMKSEVLTSISNFLHNTDTNCYKNLHIDFIGMDIEILDNVFETLFSK